MSFRIGAERIVGTLWEFSPTMTIQDFAGNTRIVILSDLQARVPRLSPLDNYIYIKVYIKRAIVFYKAIIGGILVYFIGNSGMLDLVHRANLLAGFICFGLAIDFMYHISAAKTLYMLDPRTLSRLAVKANGLSNLFDEIHEDQ